MTSRLAVACWVGAWFELALLGKCLFAAPPELTHLFPAGGQRGTTVSVVCKGKFTWPAEVYAPGVQVVVSEEKGTLAITVPSELAVDRVWLRLYNLEGASEAVPFLIGNLPEVNEREPNNSPAQAEEDLQLPLTVNGVLEGADVDSFVVHAEAGQTLVAALDAHTRLGSPIDAVLQVLLPNGTVLADNHDDFGLDPRTAFTVKETGRYVVRVFGFLSDPNQSIALQGSNRCVYRLTITTGAYGTLAVPLAVSESELDESQVEFKGWNLPDGTRTTVQKISNVLLHEHQEIESPPVEFRVPFDSTIGIAGLADAAGNARVRIVPFATHFVGDRARHDEVLPLSLPVAITDRFHVPRQRNRYTISLNKGETLLAAVEARTLGMPTDPLVRLLAPDGKQVVEMDDTAGTRDAAIAHLAAADGDYTLVVTDRFGMGGERFFYLLTARIDQPDFELRTAVDRLVVKPESPAELVINVVRRGAVGPITIRAAGLPEGVTAEEVVSETEGDSAKSVTVRLVSNGSSFSGPVRFAGTASEPVSMERTAQTPSRLGVAFERIWLTAVEQN